MDEKSLKNHIKSSKRAKMPNADKQKPESTNCYLNRTWQQEQEPNGKPFAEVQEQEPNVEVQRKPKTINNSAKSYLNENYQQKQSSE